MNFSASLLKAFQNLLTFSVSLSCLILRQALLFSLRFAPVIASRFTAVAVCSPWLILLLTSLLPISTSSATPPNVVLILADDLGVNDLTIEGSTFHETPNIDRIATEGVRFTRGYATCQVCSPSRASIVSGKYPARIPITDWINSSGGGQPGQWKRNTSRLPAEHLLALPLEEITIAEALREAGYATFIESSRDQPFFAMLCFYSVHGPDETTVELYQKYRAKALEQPEPEERFLNDVRIPVRQVQGKTIPERPLFWHYPHYSNQGGEPVSMILEGDWKLIEDLEDGSYRLYNLSEDIGEQENLASLQPERLRSMSKVLAAWKKDIGARPMTPNPTFDPEKFAAEQKANHTTRKQQLEEFHRLLLHPVTEPAADEPVTYKSQAFKASK